MCLVLCVGSEAGRHPLHRACGAPMAGTYEGTRHPIDNTGQILTK